MPLVDSGCFCGLDENQIGKMIQVINKKETLSVLRSLNVKKQNIIAMGDSLFLCIYESQARSCVATQCIPEEYVRTITLRVKLQANK